jgi:hypothetical protein
MIDASQSSLSQSAGRAQSRVFVKGDRLGLNAPDEEKHPLFSLRSEEAIPSMMTMLPYTTARPE